ncbi:MAG: 2Fe-2S iron-sulfur cluster-binding protein [Pseudomonadota bacterium]
MHVYLRGDGLQKLRLASGLVLLAFAGTHFLNHALGLVGLEAMHLAQDWRTAVTRSLPGSLVLLVALAAHVALGLHRIAQRQTWRMPPWEFVQIATGLAIPFLLLPHIVNTRIAYTVFDVEDSYAYELARLWPGSAWQQSALLLLVWGHGCIGLHHWLRLGEGYRRLQPLLAAVAVAVPVLALAGFVVAGRATAEIIAEPDAMAALKARSHWPGDVASAALADWRLLARVAFAVVGLVAITLPIQRGWRRRRGTTAIRITYSGGPAVEIQPGQTLLEASRAAGVQHASVCGGRARCSTCRVRIERGRDSLPPPEGAEAATLKAIGAPVDVRLACQVRPTRHLTVSLISAPGTPGPVQVEFDEVREAVAAHARAQALDHIVDKTCTAPGELISWLERFSGRSATLPAAREQVARLVGGRVDYLGERTVPVAVYALGSESVSVFLMPQPEAGPYMVRASRHGYRVLGWAEDRSRYIAVASSPHVALERLASDAGLEPAPRRRTRLEQL